MILTINSDYLHEKINSLVFVMETVCLNEFSVGSRGQVGPGCKNCRKLRTISYNTDGIRVEIYTRHLLSTKQECYPLNRDVRTAWFVIQGVINSLSWLSTW
jgi:hypothetical protein